MGLGIRQSLLVLILIFLSLNLWLHTRTVVRGTGVSPGKTPLDDMLRARHQVPERHHERRAGPNHASAGDGDDGDHVHEEEEEDTEGVISGREEVIGDHVHAGGGQAQPGVAEVADGLSGGQGEDEEDEFNEQEPTQVALEDPGGEGDQAEANHMGPETHLTVAKAIRQEELEVVELSTSLPECRIPDDRPREPCWKLHGCHGRLRNMAYCFMDELSDREGAVTKRVAYHYDNVTHRLNLGYPASEGHFFRARKVFVNFKGNVFTDEAFYFHGGCKGKALFALEAGTSVRRYSEVINLAHLWGHNFFHLMGEMLPRTYQVRRFITRRPDVPIVVKSNTNVENLRKVLQLEHHNLTFIFLEEGETIFANRAYFPLKVICGEAPRAVWRGFRKFFFKHTLPAITPERRNPFSKQLRIVVAERLHSRRLVGFRGLLRRLRERFSSERVTVFHGTEGLEGSIKIFSESTVFVATHGAGLTNMVYMPYRSAIVEVVPDGYRNLCFGHLAATLGFDYHMLLGEGSKHTALKVNIDLVVQEVEQAARRFTSG